MPVWDSLYQVRDFSQYVNWLRAKDSDGHPLAVHKIEKSLWHVSGTTRGAEVEYEVLANVPGPLWRGIKFAARFF